MSKTIPCPQCKEPLTWDKNNPFRPFCTERCKMLDLGDWASEKNSIPAENPTEDFQNWPEE